MSKRNGARSTKSRAKGCLGFGIVLMSGLLLACGDPSSSAPDAQLPLDSGILSDPLSMPLEPSLDSSKFKGAQSCGFCHENHLKEWKTSMHSYAMVDPVYRAIVKIRQEEFDGKEDKFCLQCHTPIGTRSGDIQPGFEFDQLEAISLEGVNCETCHTISAIERPFNAGLAMDVGGPMRGPIQGADPSSAHETEYSELFDSSLLCSSCHDVVEVSGLNLERPYAEWLESPAAQNDVQCQSCHMKTYTGKATASSSERELHEHYFVGVGLPLEEGFLSAQEFEEMRIRVANLLQGSATITLDANAVSPGQQLDLFITVRNNIVAHNLPTGATFNRQVWLEVIATDADSNVIYETGTLDSNGDLRNYWSDEEPFGDADLIEYGSRFTNELGTPEIFTWRATEHHSNSLSPLYDRTNTLFVPTSVNVRGPIHIEARLRFRAFAPYVLRVLGLPHYVERVEIFDIDSISIDVPLDPP